MLAEAWCLRAGMGVTVDVREVFKYPFEQVVASFLRKVLCPLGLGRGSRSPALPPRPGRLLSRQRRPKFPSSARLPSARAEVPIQLRALPLGCAGRGRGWISSKAPPPG